MHIYGRNVILKMHEKIMSLRPLFIGQRYIGFRTLTLQNSLSLTLFLGIAKWIVTRLWIEENRLITKHLEIMQERANKIKVPLDISRIPNKIATGDGFSGFTADQWK